MTKFAFTAGVAASSFLTMSGVFVDTKTVVVGGKTYTAQTTLTNVDGNYFKGADAEAGLKNLFDAINVGRGYAVKGGGSGVGYAALMTRNKQVFCSAVTATVATFKAGTFGTIGNLIPLTTDETNGTVDNALLEGGTGDSGLMIDEIIDHVVHLRTNAQLNADVLMHISVLYDALIVLSPQAIA